MPLRTDFVVHNVVFCVVKRGEVVVVWVAVLAVVSLVHG
jgi:hypothetical protein